jgi:hypothetical protein
VTKMMALENIDVVGSGEGLGSGLNATGLHWALL